MARRPLVVFAFLALATACGAFGAQDRVDPSPPGDAGLPDGTVTPDGTTSPPEDGGSDAWAGSACPRPRGPSCTPGSCAIRTLYANANSYPFDIATDTAHVYWVEQRTFADGGSGDPYNADGEARILRTDRTGAADASKAEILASGISRASTLVLDGPWLYFASLEPGTPSVARLKRVPAACAPGSCTVEEVAQWNNERVLRMRRSAPGVLFVQFEDGALARVEPGKGAQLIPTSGTYPSFAITDQKIYTSAGLSPLVGTVSLDGLTVTAAYAQIPKADGGNAGINPLTTDCQYLYGARAFPSGGGDVIMSVSLTDQSVKAVTKSTGYGFYDIATDDTWIYGAGVNAGGLLVVDPRDGGVTNVQPANLFRVAVDDQGVYFGDHGNSGKLFMMVK